MAEGSANTAPGGDTSLANTTPTDGGPTPYITRRINVTFQLGIGDFGEAGNNQMKLTGLRISATISKAAIGAQTECSLRIWGMPFKQMQALSTWGVQYNATKNNTVIVEAGDDVAGMTQIFTGTMVEGFFDGQNQPEVAFQVQAYEGMLESVKPAPYISSNGPVDAADLMQQLAGQMGLNFENHSGTTIKIRDVYYPGTAYQQMRKIADDYGINATIENGTLAIWPRNAARESGTIPLFAPDSGSVNYPTFNNLGCILTALFRPIALGQKVAVKSSLWDDNVYFFYPYTYSYQLMSEMPNGPWFVYFMAAKVPI